MMDFLEDLWYEIQENWKVWVFLPLGVSLVVTLWFWAVYSILAK